MLFYLIQTTVSILAPTDIKADLRITSSLLLKMKII